MFNWFDAGDTGERVGEPSYLMLASLLRQEGRWFRRETLIDGIWPESEAATAEANFYATLRHLRRCLAVAWPVNQPWIECDNGHYRVRPDRRLKVDLWDVQRLTRGSRVSAMRLGISDLEQLVDFAQRRFLVDVPTLEPWIVAMRSALDAGFVDWTVRLAQLRVESGYAREAERTLWRGFTERPESPRLATALRTFYEQREGDSDIAPPAHPMTEHRL